MRKLMLLIPAIVPMLLLGCGRSGDNVGSSGFIEADESVVSAETAGRIDRRNFDEGSRVTVGDTLLVIDPSKLQLQLASLRADAPGHRSLADHRSPRKWSARARPKITQFRSGIASAVCSKPARQLRSNSTN